MGRGKASCPLCSLRRGGVGESPGSQASAPLGWTWGVTRSGQAHSQADATDVTLVIDQAHVSQDKSQLLCARGSRRWGSRRWGRRGSAGAPCRPPPHPRAKAGSPGLALKRRGRRGQRLPIPRGTEQAGKARGSDLAAPQAPPVCVLLHCPPGLCPLQSGRPEEHRGEGADPGREAF